MAEYTPMMKHYLELKEKYPDVLIFYRLGDFYELFFDDAKTASHELDLVLTGRNAGVEEKVPMCGVPHHAVNGYIQRLILKGYKVAIVEQLEDPSTAVGLVKRDVIRVVTPGTVMDELMDERNSIYMGAIHDYQYGYAISACEMATGETKGYLIEKGKVDLEQFLKSKSIREIVVGKDLTDNPVIETMRHHPLVTVSECDDESVKEEFESRMKTIEDVRLWPAFCRMMNYLRMTQMRLIDHLQPLEIVKEDAGLYMDFSTKQNLELVMPLRANGKSETLWSYMDHCRSSMGSRLLKKWVEYPLMNKDAINQRLDMIAYLNRNFMRKQTMKDSLSKLYDLDRLIARVAYGSANARDCIRLVQTLHQAPGIIELLCDSKLYPEYENVDLCLAVLDLLDGAFVEEPPVSIKEGGMFKDGYHERLDEYRMVQREGKNWIARLENEEREKTGIKNLKIGYNRVFGYYIEVSKGNCNLVKDEWGYVRKQTLTNAERFVTSELKEREDAILHAEERAIRLETEIFLALMEQVKKYIHPMQHLAQIFAQADALYALSVVSEQPGYTRPLFNDEEILEIKDGRHPILESMNQDATYIPNDTKMNPSRNVLVITGPNMGGKSTYMRQTALILIMAQMGCYVPAKKCNMTLFDKIFTRIGANDDILSGQSTFMVEMNEANNALKNATKKSFVLFDEIGRGTSTYDGMALAQSMLEYISACIGAKTMFSTHYHELTSLEDSTEGIKNVHVEVFEKDGEVTFLYKIKDGKADRSYGINVAKLAKLPDTVLERAANLLNYFEQNKKARNNNQSQILMMEVVPERLQHIEETLKHIDPNAMTPIEALQLIHDMKKEVSHE